MKDQKDNIETVVKVVVDSMVLTDNLEIDLNMEMTALEDIAGHNPALDRMAVSHVVRSWSRVGLSVKAVV